MRFLPVLIDPILPVFAILAFGYAMGRTGRTTQEAARTINRFAMTVLIPIVLFDLLANAPFERFAGAPIALYAGTQAVIFTLGYLLARRGFGRDPGEAVILGYAGIFANNVFFGLPIARLIHGEAGILPVTGIVVLDSVVSFGGTMVALQAIALGQVSPRKILAIFGRTPALLAIFAGLGWAALGPDLPGAVRTFLDFNGAAAAPVALFALGAAMSATRLAPDAAVLSFTAIKAVVFPAAVAGALAIFAPGAADASLFVLGAAAPSGAMSLSLAILYGIRTDTVAQVMVWSTLAALFTMALIA